MSVFSEELNKKIITALVEIPADLKTKYCNPCISTIDDCGITGSIRPDIQRVIDALATSFAKDEANMIQIRDNFCSFDADLAAGYAAMKEASSRAASLVENNTSTQKVEGRVSRMMK